jgi:hypothetical protein
MYRKNCILSLMKRIICCCIFFIQLLIAIGQADSSQHLITQFDNYRKYLLQEKLFLHTDKSVYLAGEILWFKIYDIDASFHLPLTISSVAYVEILDKNNKPVLQAKLSLKNGDGSGSFFLPVSLNSGNYKLRSYTNWMKNFSPDYFFEKPLTIINTQKTAESKTQNPGLHYNIGFFPEGGNLVSGLQSKVGFRITDQYGKGVDCEALLLDNKNDTLQKFRPFKFGMGNFSFTPLNQDLYRALFRLPDGEELFKDLPRVYDSGYVMHLEFRDNQQLEISVQGKGGDFILPGQLVYLFIHTRESIKWVGSKQIQNGRAFFLIDRNIPGAGISQFTVFNNNKQPVCERLYFSYPKKKLELALSIPEPEYSPRKKVIIDINAKDQEGNPKQPDMSLAVYRLDSLQGLDGFNIDNYLWLSSDLRGPVESPDYYFKKENPGTEEAMDNLMLTQGWRRFSWENVLQNKNPGFDYMPEYNGHIITGNMTDRKTGSAGKNIEGFLSVPGTCTQFREALSDSNGNIKFEMKNLYGSQEIIVQTNPLIDSEYRIDITSPFIDRYSSTPLPYFSMTLRNPSSLLYSSINTQVQNLYTGRELQQFVPSSSDTSAFYLDPDSRYILDDYTRFTTLEEIIREYILGVNIYKNEGRFNLVITNQDGTVRMTGDPLVLIDGVPVFDIDKFINYYDPLKLYKLEVVKRKYFLGYKSFDGILNFTTYKGDLDGYELEQHAIALDYAGLQLQRKYYSPDYEIQPQIDTHIPDFRNLLYWTPEIKTNSQGKQETSFYTSDIPGKYAIVLQGLDSSGITGNQVLFFEVKSK